MKTRVLFALLAVSVSASADPGFRLVDSSTIEVCWVGESGKQYAVYSSPDLEDWSPLGEIMEGVEGAMSARDDISGAPEKFYKVEALGGVLVDPQRFMFGTVGNKWVYDVVKDTFLGFEVFTWETEIAERTVYNGENVVAWIYNRDGFWDQTIHLLDDFTNGIFEVGGEAPGQPAQVNDPPAPSLFASFTPGEAVEVEYLSGADTVSDLVTMTVESEPFVVPAGSFEGVIKVVHEYERFLMGFQVTGTTTEWFGLEVGLLKHVGVFEVLGSVSTNTFELRTYAVE